MLRIPLHRGRIFSAFDRAGARHVAIINEAMARMLWPGQDAMGRRFRPTINSFYWEVIGVVGDLASIGTGAPPMPTAYLPIEQSYQATAALVVRTNADPAAFIKQVMSNVQRLDPNLALVGELTMSDAIFRSLWAPPGGR